LFPHFFFAFGSYQISDISADIYNEICEFGNAEPQKILRWTEVLFPNMVVTLEKILDVQTTVTAIESAIEGVQGSIEANSVATVPVDPNPNPVSFRGCNGKDDDFDAFVDECDEDNSPPQVVVPDTLKQQNTCMGKENTVCLDLYFKNITAAIEYLHATLRVEDDCALSPAIRLDIQAITVAACDMTKFVVTPVHNCTSERGIASEVCGTAITFEIGVDGEIPAVACGFDSEFATTSPNGTSILILDEEDDNYEDTGFFFDVEENCPENVRVDISVETNELVKNLQDMIVLASVRKLNGVDQVTLCVDSGYCGDTSKKGSKSFCIRDPDPRVKTRFYEIKVDATDAAGNKDSEICVVFVRPNGGKKEEVVDQEELWNSYVLWSETRYFLRSASIAWENELAPSEMPSMIPSISTLPTVPSRSKKSSSSEEEEDSTSSSRSKRSSGAEEEENEDLVIIESDNAGVTSSAPSPSPSQHFSMPTWPKRGFSSHYENINADDVKDATVSMSDSAKSKKAKSEDNVAASDEMETARESSSASKSSSEKSKKEKSNNK
jgi:hypothetical protein